MTFLETMEQTRRQQDFHQLLADIPYAQFIGMELVESCDNTQLADDTSAAISAPVSAPPGFVCSADGSPVFKLPPKQANIGNPILPAIHGGVIGGFMELSAVIHLFITMETIALPKIVDFSLDYLRAAKLQDTFASCSVCRQGNRIANLAITAWQEDPAKPIATARAHFLLSASE